MVFRRQVDVAALDAADRAGSDHPGIVRTRIEAHRQRMGEIFKERDVGKAGDHTPRARGRIAEHGAVRNPISAVPAKGRGAPAGGQRGQAFRAVHRIGIVAGAVPGDDAENKAANNKLYIIFFICIIYQKVMFKPNVFVLT